MLITKPHNRMVALRLILSGGLSLAMGAIAAAPSWANAAAIEPFLRPPMVCPQNVETLTTGLLRDLPSYANRVARRTLGTTPDDTQFGTMLLAGRAEFEPLPLETLAFEPVADDATQQVFFTTLERRYLDDETIRQEQYHWLFLVPTAEGWRLTLMFSRLAAADQPSRPPTPPQESSDGIMGQAVRLWLRDCRAGTLFPIEADTPIPGAADRPASTGR
ncbi:hypothetical protein [Halomicronema sp. CCY15110]|uniref:hypothetical protein n=1 Tax=Halomicronema sp. CCY15110 TaxID=2767773 RepID=UPI00194F3A10|nr:hypothetical protein [Halomicronema sp. CCY15110]